VNWTGTQWSTGFLVDVNIGLINAGAIATIVVTDAKFVRPHPITFRVEIDVRWAVFAPANFPVIISATLNDATTGEVELQLFNPLGVNTDFGIRSGYFEFAVPYYSP
jgi:hypothetical protein